MVLRPASAVLTLLLLLLAFGLAGPAVGDSGGEKKDSSLPAPKDEKKAEWVIPDWLDRTVNRTHVRKGATRAEREAAAVRTPPYASAIAPALTWLEKQQQESGRWSAGVEGGKDRDVGVSGLAVLAFLSNGETIRSGPHDRTVMQGVKWLMTKQNKEGIFAEDFKQGTQAGVYGHAIATLALAEAYGMTGSVYLKTAAQRGVDAIHRMQNPYLAWRYGIRPQDNDSSVCTWMVHALYSAKVAGLRVSKESFDGAKAWIEKATEPEYGRVGYTSRGTSPPRSEGMLDRFPPDKSESLTAMGVFTRILLGEDPRKSETIAKGVDLIRKVPMEWDHAGGTIDTIYWHFGALAVFQADQKLWKEWEKLLKTEIADSQITEEGDRKGSWNPIGAWGEEGGRVFTTAMLTLTLQTYRRYPNLVKTGKMSPRKNYRNLR